MFKDDDKILIFNGTDEIDGIGDFVKSKIEEVYPEAHVKEIVLRDIEMKPCVSCFNCWLKTPGKCMVDEHANEFVSKMLASDQIIWITDIVFGSYGYTMKKMIDRLIQIALPFFKTVKGETRHYERYDNYPGLMIIGIQKENNAEEKEIFKTLVERNRLNFKYKDEGLFIMSKDENNDALDNIFGLAVKKEGA